MIDCTHMCLQKQGVRGHGSAHSACLCDCARLRVAEKQGSRVVTVLLELLVVCLIAHVRGECGHEVNSACEAAHTCVLRRLESAVAALGDPCVYDCTRSRAPVCCTTREAKIKGSLAVVSGAVNVHMCVAEASSLWSQFCCLGVSADTCLLWLGSFPCLYAHMCAA